MVAFRLPPDVGQQLLTLAHQAGIPDECLMPLDDMHVTLALLDNDQDADSLNTELKRFADGWPSMSGDLNGIGRFVDSDDQDCIYANFDSPDLPRFRQALVAFLKGLDVNVVEDHGYTPHATIAYIPKDMPTPHLPLEPLKTHFHALWQAHGEKDYNIPFKAVDQDVADYTANASNPAERCVMCEHFLAPHSCQVVTGDISPEGWCKYFAKGVKAIPYKIVKRKNGKWFVKNTDTGKLAPENGYDTRAEATNYQRALYANEPAASKSVHHAHKPSNYNNATYPTDTAGPESSIQTATGSAEKDAEGNYAYPEEKKLPMPDAGHVVLAAAALGPNPPHGHGANIPKGELSKVKARIRSRAHELNLGKDQLAKVNAYLSGHMPSEKMSAKEVAGWHGVYEKVLKQTGDEIKAAAAAQGHINRAMMVGSKSAAGELPTSIAGWAMLFSDPQDLDLQGTYFNSLTDTMADYYEDAPLWMEHGADRAYGSDPIGHRTKCEVYPFGIWLEHDLHTDHPLYSRTAKDVLDGTLSYSSDSLSHYAAQGYNPDDGHLAVWPLAGCSLTHSPAEPGLGLVTAKTLEALKSVSQQREVAGNAVEPTKTQHGEVMDKKDELVGVDDVNDNFDDAPETEEERVPGTTLEALAQMYGVNPEPEVVRKAMDDHIAKMKADGTPDAELVKAMGWPEETKADDVADHLNNLYSAAMAVPEPPEPEPHHILNYAALSSHLHSGGMAAKSRGPYFTGNIAEKAVNQIGKAQKPSLQGFVADVILMSKGLYPKYTNQGYNGRKAMTSATGPTGGYILHQEIADTVLDPLRAKVVCFQLGAQEHNMQGTNVLTVPVMNSAPSAAWVGENQSTTDSQPGYRTVTLYPRGIYSLVKVPFNVEANMTPQAEGQLRTQMAKSIALKLDLACLQGSGGADASGQGVTPIGILNTPGAQTYDMGGNGRVPQFTDIGQAFGLLDDQNVPMDDESRRGIAMHTQLSRAFTLATDTLGHPLLRPAWRAAAERELLAMPYGLSTQISTNVTYGTATNASYVFVGDFQYMYIGLSDQIEVRLDQTFAGNLQAGLLIYMYADMKIVYPQAFVTMKGVLPPSIAGVTTGTNTVS